MYLSNTGTESEDFGPLKIGLKNHRTERGPCCVRKMGPVLSTLCIGRLYDQWSLTTIKMRRWTLSTNLRITVARLILKVWFLMTPKRVGKPRDVAKSYKIGFYANFGKSKK